MGSKYTPGPWFTTREGFSTVYVEARLRGSILQEVAACGPTELGSEQQEANARLIACAPELLEALEIMYDYAGFALDVLSHEEATLAENELSKAKKIIAKAKGE